MEPPRPHFYYDLIDPLSYLMEREVTAVEATHDVRFERVPFELRPPPEPLIDPDGDPWRRRWTLAETLAEGTVTTLRRPALVPWSRKAHELVLHAAEVERADEVRRGLFELAFEKGADLGRVDVLVSFAGSLGLDPSRTKAVLDVDRHAEAVAEAGRRARAAGVAGAPAASVGDRVAQGFHNRDALVTLLG